MSRRILSALLVFLILTAVAIPAVTAAEAPQVYYELHDMCLCGAHADLGKIPFATFGIGYETHNIDPQSDKWELFIHAGAATKKIIITPATPTGKMVLLRDFVNAVNKCKDESEQVPSGVVDALGYGGAAATGIVGGSLWDCAPALGGGIVMGGYTATEVYSFVDHFNNAKNAQKKAEKLFGEL